MDSIKSKGEWKNISITLRDTMTTVTELRVEANFVTIKLRSRSSYFEIAKPQKPTTMIVPVGAKKFREEIPIAGSIAPKIAPIRTLKKAPLITIRILCLSNMEAF